MREADITVADMGEFGLIAAIAALAPPGPAQVVGIGDDAAVLRAPDGRVVATMDMLVQDRHFRLDWSSAFDIGCKAAAQNLADIAAMGASPVALLVGFAAPGDLAASWAQELARGLVAECSRCGAQLAGGDVSSAEKITLAITALGDLAGRAPVTRAGARPGDQVAVAGQLGYSAAGFALLSAGLTEPSALVERHRRPRPPYQAGPEAAGLGATAMIDVSDGLLADLGHVAGSSGVRIEVESGPLADARLRAAAAALGGADWRRWALTGGEDHALAATFPPGIALPGHWTVIGAVARGEGVRVDGTEYAGPSGWNHFPEQG
ncbi:MAG TPA: thiamine-phosphate kinase [Streptosporangiaceae bacterium]|jgi:thiamine-monophosphate kinase